MNLARQERVAAQVWRDFMRGRLERHQEELLTEVGRLKQVVSRASAYSLDARDPMKRKLVEGLSQHLKGWPLPRRLEQYRETARLYRTVRNDLRRELREEETEPISELPQGIELHPWTEKVLDLFDRLIALRSPWEDQYEIIKEGSGYHVEWRGFPLTRTVVDEVVADKIVEAHRKLSARAQMTLTRIRGHHERLRELGKELADQLDVFLLRQVVPGRCEYCPVEPVA